MDIKASIAVHTGIAQQIAVFALHAGAFDDRLQRLVQHLLRAFGVLGAAERLRAHRNVIRHQHGDEQIDHAAQDIEDQRVERFDAQPLPLPSEEKRLIGAHAVVEIQPALIVDTALIGAPDGFGINRFVHPDSPFAAARHS